jgi:hypothetical protein
MNDFLYQRQHRADLFIIEVVTAKGTRWFENMTEALKVYPILDPCHHTTAFTWGMFDGMKIDRPIMRFEDWEINRLLSV